MKFVHEKIEMGYETLDRVEAADGRRYVTLEGKNYPSVTTVLNLVHRDKIQEWRKRVGEDKANQISVQATNRGTAVHSIICLLYTSPSPRDRTRSRMPSSA